MKNIRIPIVLLLFTLVLSACTSARAESENTVEQNTSVLRIPVITKMENTKSGIKINWKKVEGAEGYTILRNGKKLVTLNGENTTSYKDEKAKTNGAKYKYRIVAYKKGAQSSTSEKKGQYYLKKNRFDVLYMKDGSVYANWKTNEKCSGYEIMYSTNDDFSNSTTVKVKGKAVNQKNIRLSSKGNYYFRIRNYKGKSYSVWSRTCIIINWDSSWEFAQNSILHSDAVTLYRSYASHRVKKVVCVNAGHGTVGGNSVKTLCHPDGSKKVTGGSTAAGETRAAAVSSGTVLNSGISEADATLNLAIVTKNVLLKAGYDVLMIREDKNVNIDNVARTVFANNYADYHIALHYDSSQNDKGAFYIGVPKVDSYLNMYPVSKTYRKHESLGKNLINGMKDTGVKIYGNGCMALDLTQTSYSKIASVDIEVGDRASDTSKKTLKKIAKGILKGLNNEAGI